MVKPMVKPVGIPIPIMITSWDGEGREWDGEGGW
jgi:hypothetical protein